MCSMCCIPLLIRGQRHSRDICQWWVWDHCDVLCIPVTRHPLYPLFPLPFFHSLFPFFPDRYCDTGLFFLISTHVRPAAIDITSFNPSCRWIHPSYSRFIPFEKSSSHRRAVDGGRCPRDARLMVALSCLTMRLTVRDKRPMS